MSGFKRAPNGKALPENKLAIVVARANELRNVLKLDKQSPFVTLRLQDQETSTRVLPRAGQTPRWDEAHWFSLDGIDLNQEKNRTISVNVYHQKKGDAKLICSGDIDYTPALTQSVNDGYDGWFDLYWDGRSAGKIFLEFTYYPKLGQVPIGTQSLGRSSQQKQSAGVKKSIMGNAGIMKTDELPVLENGFKSDGDDDTYSDIDQDPESKKSSLVSSTGEGGIFHFLDKKLQNLAGKFGGATTGTTSEGWLSLTGAGNVNEGDGDVKRKVESPELIKKAPRNLFGDSLSDEDDEDDEEEIRSGLGNIKLNARSSIAKRQQRILNEASRKSSDDDYDYDDNDDAIGTSNFDKRTSVSYKNKPLPTGQEDVPPPPPKHTVPTNSLFESTKQAPAESSTELSWYERRMKSRRQN